MGEDFDWTQLLSGDTQLSWNDFLPDVEGVSWNDFLPEVQEITWNDFLPDASGKPAFEEDYRNWLYGKEGYGEGMTGQQTARYDYVLEKTGSKTLADLAATKGFDALTNAFQAAKNVFGSPAGMTAIGALLGAADRQRPSGGGTTMAYQGPAELKRKMVQGPYGPVAEYEGVGGGAPDYTRFAAPTAREAAPAPRAPTGQTAQQKADLYKFMRDSIGMSDAQIRQFANYSYGDQKDSDWQELLQLVGGDSPVAAPAPETPATKGASPIQTIDPNKDYGINYGFTRDPNAFGGMAMVPWYNKKTGQTYIASDTAWRPPNEDWAKGEFDATGGVKKIPGQAPMGDIAQEPIFQILESASPQAKAKEYNRLRNAGFTDAQIREQAGFVFGSQSDEDWQALLNLAMPSATPTGQQTTGPIGYKAGDAQATFGNRVYGPRYEAELKDEDLRNALAVSGAKAVADASTAGGVYQRGDLTPVYTPNFSDPVSVAQFEQYYPHAKQYGTSFFTPDVLEVDPGFAAYHNLGAQASIENAVEEARTRGEDPVAARERIRAEQDALHNRLYSGKGLLAGATGAGGLAIDPGFLSSLGVDPYAGLDRSFRSALDLKPYELYTAPGETNPWGQYKEVLPALDVASGRLSYEQGQAIKQGYEANKNLQSYTQHTNIRDQMVKNLQNELANLKYDPANLESYNRTREDLMGRIQSMGGETEQFKQNLAQGQDAMKTYADVLSGIKDWSGLSSNLIKGGLGLAHGGPVRMEDGGFVMTKRAVDGAGGPRGIQQLVPGARMIRGPGHGTSDSIPAYIQGRNGRTPARLSNGEAYVPPGQDTSKLYDLMKSLERNA